MAKTALELAFRDAINKERSKNIRKWPEGDVRRTITVALWDAKEARKEQFISKNNEEVCGNGGQRNNSTV
jgi:hypothetical protein